MYRDLIVAVVALIVTTPEVAGSWGNEGHRIVGEIAYQQLTPTARKAVIRILPNRGRYRTLFEGATWADTYARGKREYAALQPQHYINGDPEAATVDVAESCGDKGCVVSAIIENACVLKSGDEERELEALYLLSHFVGDIHQPLHVAHPDGRGGNLTRPRFLGDEMSLHSIWDTALIKYHLQDYETRDEDQWESDFDEYATWDIYAGELAQSLPPSASTWKTQLDPSTWATESLVLAKKHAFGVKGSDRLKEEYYEEVIPVVGIRLQQAGVRLAALLNSIFSSASIPFTCR